MKKFKPIFETLFHHKQTGKVQRAHIHSKDETIEEATIRGKEKFGELYIETKVAGKVEVE